MSTSYAITVISGSLTGQRQDIADFVSLGRNPTNTISFQGPDAGTVSGNHAQIGIDKGLLYVVDQGSTNGTWVNGVRVDTCQVNIGDVVSLGVNGPKIQVIDKNAPANGPVSEVPNYIYDPSSVKAATRPDSGQILGMPPGAEAGNYTMNLARRISTGEADHAEMGDLIKNKKRVDRLQSTDMVDDRDLRMIKSASDTYKKSRIRLFSVIAVISFVALVVVSILVVQNIDYRNKLSKQDNLLKNINKLNSQFEDGSGMDEDKKLELLGKLRAQERMLARLRKKINTKDLATLYKNPLGIEIHKVMEDFGESNYIVPDIFIEQVGKYIKTWQRSGKFVRRAFANKNKHAAMILRELDAANMPRAFLYLAMHESSLDSTIVSRAGARGIWQFMPRTGRDYGLKVHKNWRKAPVWVDERTNPLKSTRAAIKYLKVLIGQFGTVPLAMAAYNAGEGRISRELRKIDDPINNRDFWYIYRSGTLAAETNAYVPKIVATMVIDKNRQKYNF